MFAPETKLNPNGRIQLPATEIPSFRSSLAIERGVERNILFKTWGGLGDQICAEPTMRFAFRTFKDCTFSLASECPDLFRHLPWEEVFDLKKVQPLWEKYFVFETIRPVESLQWEFMSHMLVNCVDYPSLCAFRCQLPTADRQVTLFPSIDDYRHVNSYTHARTAVVHAGRHWPSKTFPKDWWDSVLKGLIEHDIIPILIGANTDDNRGTVDVDTNGCWDLRNELSVMQSVALLHGSGVLLTNDSSPLHMAVSGPAWIGYIATCKHPDFITHWRTGEWSWRMENLGLGGVWDTIDYCPNKENQVTAEFVPEELLRTWLPAPDSVVDWTLDKLGE